MARRAGSLAGAAGRSRRPSPFASRLVDIIEDNPKTEELAAHPLTQPYERIAIPLRDRAVVLADDEFHERPANTCLR